MMQKIWNKLKEKADEIDAETKYISENKILVKKEKELTIWMKNF